MSEDTPSKEPPAKIALPQGVCVAIAKKLIQDYTNILDQDIALDLIDGIINSRSILETFYQLRIKNDAIYFIEQSSRLSIMYMILGESLGSSSPEAIKSKLVGYSMANPQVISRMSKCIQEARFTYKNLH